MKKMAVLYRTKYPFATGLSAESVAVVKVADDAARRLLKGSFYRWRKAGEEPTEDTMGVFPTDEVLLETLEKIEYENSGQSKRAVITRAVDLDYGRVSAGYSGDKVLVIKYRARRKGSIEYSKYPCYCVISADEQYGDYLLHKLELPLESEPGAEKKGDITDRVKSFYLKWEVPSDGPQLTQAEVGVKILKIWEIEGGRRGYATDEH